MPRAAQCSMRCNRVAGRSHTSWKRGADRGGGRRSAEEEASLADGQKGKKTAASSGSEKLFRYDRNLRTRPAAGIRTNRTTATPLDFLLASQPFLRSIRDFNSPFAWAIETRRGREREEGGGWEETRDDPVAIRYACHVVITRVFVHTKGTCARNKQNRPDFVYLPCALHTCAWNADSNDSLSRNRVRLIMIVFAKQSII